MKKKIVIIDLEVNNIFSIHNILNNLSDEILISNKKTDIIHAKKIILPGNGSFGNAMKKVNDFGLKEIIKDVVNSGTPTLGICLGMQLFFESSEEDKNFKGLGILNGNVKKLNVDSGCSLPHIGWNNVSFQKSKCKLFQDINSGTNFYFANSYSCHLDYNLVDFYSYTDHCKCKFVSSFSYNNIYGVQFHPEKSQKFGFKLLNNFLNI
ncbi:imidazole glycerol phosphate synthase subunit HisH [Alphaproteobacteria bacterium]|nr:imidazole glycerol phosphate synthase subunit HisH [Alphaproteobacteria bacterium]